MASHGVEIVVKARDEASRKFGAIGGAFRNLAYIAAGYFSLTAIKNFVAGSIKAYNDEELAIRHLSDTLEGLGAGGKTVMDDMRNFAKEVQNSTVIADDLIIETMALGASISGFTGPALKAATLAAIGYSKALKMDLETAMRMVAKAAEGNFGAFQKYRIEVDQSKTNQENFIAILTRGVKEFQKAEGEVNTNIGALLQLQNAWGDTQEGIGQFVVKHTYLMDNLKLGNVILRNSGLAWNIWSTNVQLAGEKAASSFTEFNVNMKAWIDWQTQNIGKAVKKATLKDWIVTPGWNIGENIMNFVKEGIFMKWTPLLEGLPGYKEGPPGTIGLPETFHRKVLEDTLKKLSDQFDTAMKEVFVPKGVDTQKVINDALSAGFATPEKEKKIKSVSGERSGGLAARESRSMTFAPGTRFGKTEVNTAKTANAAVQTVNLIKTSNQLLQRIAANSSSEYETADMD